MIKALRRRRYGALERELDGRMAIRRDESGRHNDPCHQTHTKADGDQKSYAVTTPAITSARPEVVPCIWYVS
ncbi:MAG: hypothetical protein PVS2B1_02620 [Candidatus Dormibacteraceae bacterium]